MKYAGNYYNQIVEALRKERQPTDVSHTKESLFYCTGAANGDIAFQAYCARGCQDGGIGNSDFCKWK